jgi:hypothetical protein
MKYGWQKMRDAFLELERTGAPGLSLRDDVWSGSDFMNLFAADDATAGIREHDSVILFSTDGAQVYRNKTSDCWFSIAVTLNLPPELRYKNNEVLPLAIIPGGENKPKNMDSFNYPVFHEMGCLMKEGMSIFDADDGQKHDSRLFLPLACADGPAMTSLDGGVGHSGALGCRLKCPFKGRHKAGRAHYYPALQKPHDYDVLGCNHADQDPIDIAQWAPDHQAYLHALKDLLACRTTSEYNKVRLQTGLTKPSLFLGFPQGHILGVPGSFPLDMFHVPALNAPDLLINLWRATLDCDTTDDGDSRDSWTWAEFLRQTDLWREHGAKVGSARPYLPSWFDNPPRNPAEKLNTKFKGWEFMLYLYGLGPMCFQKYLAERHWEHFCKLVRILEVNGQEELTTKDVH